MSNLDIYMPARNRVELHPYEDAPLGSAEVRGRTLASIDSPGSILAILGGAMPESLPARPGHAAVTCTRVADNRRCRPGRGAGSPTTADDLLDAQEQCRRNDR